MASLAFALSVASVQFIPTPRAFLEGDEWLRIRFGLMLLLPVALLALLEQYFRSLGRQAGWAMKPLNIALAGSFAFDVVLFSEGALFGHLDPDLVAARGLVQIPLIPAMEISRTRTKGRAGRISLSRQAIFHSSAFLGVGAYLLAIAGAGYYMREYGGTWAGAMQAAFLTVAGMALVGLLLSGSLRSWLRVFIGKHFFRYRFDYRQEWLRFVETLTRPAPSTSTEDRVVAALANLTESPGGSVWLRQSDGRYRLAGDHSPEQRSAEIDESHGFIGFLASSGWIVALNPDDDASAPASVPIPDVLSGNARNWAVVPLPSDEGLLGFVVLAQPRTALALDWETRDVLKTGARQAAGHIQFERTTRALIEANQFAAFSRMSAFVVHDLKNLVAQLALLSRNARKYGADPEFQSDMLETVEHVTDRMSRLLMQLREGAKPVEPPHPVRLHQAVHDALRVLGESQRVKQCQIGDDLQVLAHPERLSRILRNLIQNAIDATSQQGSVSLEVSVLQDKVQVYVCDTGCGMSEDFVRDELFRPFSTTKQGGLGIGAFESRRYVEELGGSMQVESRPQLGTRVGLTLPRHCPMTDTAALACQSA